MTDDGVVAAIQLFKCALELYPQLARAWSAIARADMIKAPDHPKAANGIGP